MIDKNVVKRLVEEWLAGKEYFLVDVQVGTDDRIVVEKTTPMACGWTTARI